VEGWIDGQPELRQDHGIHFGELATTRGC
jgi:hypothetical protein